MRIVINSMGRSKTIQTHRIVENYVVSVPEAELEAYAETIPREKIVCHPDTVVGLSAKMNWGLDNLMDDEGIVFMDDDLRALYRLINEGDNPDVVIKDPATIEAILYRMYVMASDMDAWLFGFLGANPNSAYYSGLDPFSMTGYINNTCIGFVRGSKLRYDTRLAVKVDYDVCLKNAYLKRFSFREGRYGFFTDQTFIQEGELSKYRNSVVEQQCVDLLKNKYGPAIAAGSSGSIKRKVEYQGITKMNIKLPF